MVNISRRNFIKNAAGILIAAPMVVKAESLMKIVKPYENSIVGYGFDLATDKDYSCVIIKLGKDFGMIRRFEGESDHNLKKRAALITRCNQ